MKRWLVTLALAALAAGASAQGEKKLKVYISVDMEGVVGAVTGDQLGPAGFEYARFREFMTQEALAAVRAAKEAGATEVLVADAHGNGENLLIEQLPADVRVVRSWPRAGRDGLGRRRRGRRGAARRRGPEGAEVKRALGFHAADSLAPEAARALIARKVKAALARRAGFKPFAVQAPVTVDVTFKHYRPAEVLAFLPLFERAGARTVRYRARDMREASDVMVFLTNYEPGLEP
jgi:D-aminopeptidase